MRDDSSDIPFELSVEVRSFETAAEGGEGMALKI
jgi:hypothetical protein